MEDSKNKLKENISVLLEEISTKELSFKNKLLKIAVDISIKENIVKKEEIDDKEEEEIISIIKGKL